MSQFSLNSRVFALFTLSLLLMSCSTSGQQDVTPPTSANSQPTVTIAPAIDSTLGDVTHFDPIATYAAVSKQAGDGAKLERISFNYVRSDGTLDLTASYDPHVYYFFYKEMDGAPTNAPPVGAGGKLNQHWYRPIDIDVKRREDSGTISYIDQYASDATNEAKHPVAAPTCPLKGLWDVALGKGAPPKAVATIYYDTGGYNFTINDTSVSLQFDLKCQFKSGIGLTPPPTDTLEAPAGS
jgi:hypothetical protein